MRFTSILKKLLGVTQLYVRGIAMDRHDAISVEVTPAWRKPRCAECGRRAAQYDHPTSVGRWQDLNWGPVRIYLVYRCRRVTCARCGGEPRTERLPWAAAGMLILVPIMWRMVNRRIADSLERSPFK